VTYRVYIKEDYKNKVERIDVKKESSPFIKPVLFGFSILVIAAAFIFGTGSSDSEQKTPDSIPTVAATPDKTITTPASSSISSVQIPGLVDEAILVEGTETVTENLTHNKKIDVAENNNTETVYLENEAELITPEESNVNEIETANPWQSVKVKSGDSLALIFSRLGLSPTTLYNIMSLGKQVSNLKKIRPGQILNFHIEDDKLIALEYEMNLTKTLLVEKTENKFSSEIKEVELERVVKNTSAIINDSLFLAGKRAGMTDNLIMQLVAVYGWDIDFALDIREGDSFTVIYEEQYKDGVKVSDGPIIAAEFVNRDTPLRAIRYKHDDGRVDYYADNGDAMRKAFLRTPVELARISSRFNLKRRHPILNKIRAHKGVDYAASTGTPIKATGDGTVIHAGKKGGYGRTVILKHGGKYSTLYAHMHRYAKGVRTGARVKQGQVIGYVGKSGLATGPHLHYEFRINGVHRNPLTVKLPKVESINKKHLAEFKAKINPMLVELNRITGKSAIAIKEQNSPIKLANATMEDG
jgi:murein DD-endopeptidase MepM/ murein hydrolase activator NlpD